MFQTPEAIYQKAKQERVELKIAKANMDIAEKDVKIARGATNPHWRGFTVLARVPPTRTGLPVRSSIC
jgi:outer membrane protein